MRCSGTKWIFAWVLSTIFVFTMATSGFCETLNFPEEYSAIVEAIYASQEALYATSEEDMRCWDCHCPSDDPDHPDSNYDPNVTYHHHNIDPEYGGDPNSPYNPNCPDPPEHGYCWRCHFNYIVDENGNCKGQRGEPPIYGNGCVACHTLPTACGLELELPPQCIEQLKGPCFQYLPGGCFEQPEPDVMVQDLVDTVIELNLQQGISNSLDSKLESALGALDDVNENNDVAAINTLNAFINAVEAQRGDKITDEQADTLIAAAQAIINRLQS